MEVLRTSNENIQTYDKDSGIDLLEAGNSVSGLNKNRTVSALAIKTTQNFNSYRYDIETKSGYLSDTKTAATS